MSGSRREEARQLWQQARDITVTVRDGAGGIDDHSRELLVAGVIPQIEAGLASLDEDQLSPIDIARWNAHLPGAVASLAPVDGYLDAELAAAHDHLVRGLEVLQASES